MISTRHRSDAQIQLAGTQTRPALVKSPRNEWVSETEVGGESERGGERRRETERERERGRRKEEIDAGKELDGSVGF